jgi:hypothetical protein
MREPHEGAFSSDIIAPSGRFPCTTIRSIAELAAISESLHGPAPVGAGAYVAGPGRESAQPGYHRPPCRVESRCDRWSGCTLVESVRLDNAQCTGSPGASHKKTLVRLRPNAGAAQGPIQQLRTRQPRPICPSAPSASPPTPSLSPRCGPSSERPQCRALAVDHRIPGTGHKWGTIACRHRLPRSTLRARRQRLRQSANGPSAGMGSTMRRPPSAASSAPVEGRICSPRAPCSEP